MTKQCSKCDTIQDADLFPRSGSNGRRSSMCRPCKQEYDREYFKNKVDHKKRQEQKTLLRDRNADYLIDFLKDKSCMDCGIRNPLVLEFDHKNPTDKYLDVAKLVCNGAALDTLQTEIDKCDVVCANCHRLRTMKQFEQRRYIRSMLA